MIFFKNIHNRLDRIEQVLIRVEPMVEEYHAARVLRQSMVERVKPIALLIGLILPLSALGKVLFDILKQ